MFTDMLLTEAWRNAPYLHAYDVNGSYVGTYETDPIDSWHNGWKTYPSPRIEMVFTHPYLEIKDLPTLVEEIGQLVEERRYVVELGILRQQDTESNYWTNNSSDQSWITPWDPDWPQSATLPLSEGMDQSDFYKFENPNSF